MPSKRAIKNVGKAFDRMRQAGGSIVNGQSGTNYTKSGTGESFANYVAKNLCDDEDGLKHIASMINAAIDEGARQEDLNAQDLTDPECFSKPMVEINPGCLTSYWMVARNGRESNCSDGN